MEKTIIVTGIGGNVGQGIIRNIKNSFPEIRIIGIDINSYTPANHLCDKTFKVPYSYEDNFINVIVKIIKDENANLIIPSTDYESYYLSKSKDLLKIKVAASTAKITKLYLDKYSTYLHHLENNIPFAKSWLPEDFDFSVNQIIAKPREGRGSRGILINPENPKSLPEGYMIQELAVGKEITSAIYATQEGEIHGLFTMERELENGTTIKSKVTFEYDLEIKSIAKKMLLTKGLKGSFNIQSIVTIENQIIPFEINCRISGTNSIRHNLGFQDVVYTIEELLLERKPTPAKPIKGIASRILLDVIYPNISDEEDIINQNPKHIIY